MDRLAFIVFLLMTVPDQVLPHAEKGDCPGVPDGGTTECVAHDGCCVRGTDGEVIDCGPPACADIYYPPTRGGC